MTILVRAAALRGYAELARACGVVRCAPCNNVRLSQFNLKDVDSLIPYVAFINLLEQTANKSGCADFGLRLAQAQGIGVLGQLAVLFQHASNAGEALTLASRHIFVHSPAVQLGVRPWSTTRVWSILSSHWRFPICRAGCRYWSCRWG
ncbi:MAG: AraC family transcriptional regulator ligand-binding domain-containing protein [Rhodoferax sp.]|nr:AraC family transcriptional regulator ligand-binding domain-containing protein [Rhodoferax sp.]